MKRLPVLLLLLIAACQPASNETQVLPTLAVLPSLTPSQGPTAVPTTAGPTDTPTITLTPTITMTFTPAPTFTSSPTWTQTPRATIEPTLAAVGTGTAAAQEAPRFSTVTPGGNVASTPQVVADVVITERQFQEELNAQVGAYPSIQRARVDFVPGGINVELTALGGQAFITGNVFVSIELTGSFATISIGDITVNAPEPPEAYIETVTGDFFGLMVNVLDTILTQRLGEENDLENIVVTDTSMEITLLVPQP